MLDNSGDSGPPCGVPSVRDCTNPSAIKSAALRGMQRGNHVFNDLLCEPLPLLLQRSRPHLDDEMRHVFSPVARRPYATVAMSGLISRL